MRRAGWVVAALTAAAFALRLAGMGQSLFGDEVFTYDIVTRHGLGGVLDEVRRTSITPPLHYVLAWASVQLGDPTWTVRLPSLVAGTLTVPAIWLLGRVTVGDGAGVAAAGLAALSPFLVYYGQEARTYALLVLLVTLSTLGLVRALESGRRRWWVLFAVTSAAALYCHYTAAFPLAAQFLWALATHRHQRRQLLAWTAATAVLLLPWLPFYLEQRGNAGIEAIGFLYPLSLRSAVEALTRVGVGHPFVALSSLPGSAALAVAGGAFVALSILAPTARARRSDVTFVSLFALLAVSAPVGELVYSVLGSTIYAPRNLLPSVPGALLLMTGLASVLPRTPRFALAAAAFLVLITGAAKGLGDAARRPPWRQAATFVDNNATCTDAVGVYAFLTGRTPERKPALRSLVIFLKGPHPVFQFSPEDPAPARLLRRASGVCVVVNQLAGLPGVPDPPTLPGFRVVGRSVDAGFSDVAVYRYIR